MHQSHHLIPFTAVLALCAVCAVAIFPPGTSTSTGRYLTARVAGPLPSGGRPAQHGGVTASVQPGRPAGGRARVIAAGGMVPRVPGQRGGPRHPAVLGPRFGPSIHLLDPLRYPAGDAQYARQPLPDDEPSVVIAPDGAVWIAALHLHHGTALWHGRFGGPRPVFVGQPDGGLGGDDVALALGVDSVPPLPVPSATRVVLSTVGTSSAPATSTPVSGATATVPLPRPLPPVAPRLPVSTAPALYVAAMTARVHHIAVTACPRGDVAGNFAACRLYAALGSGRHDRPWLATAGRSTVYLAYSGPGVLVRRSLDAGRTWSAGVNPVAGVAGGTLSLAGTLVADPHSGALYVPFDDGFRLLVASSRDGGRTWRTVTAYQGVPGEDDANFWPSMALDAGGTLYVAWSNLARVVLVSSRDSGLTWSPAIRVDHPGPGLRTSVMPWVAAGAAGHVALAWYGTPAAGNMSPAAAWRVLFAESFDGGHTFAQAFATPVIHRGPVCTKGEACAYTDRQLLDLLGMALDPVSGRAAIAYARSIDFGDYRACRAAADCPQVYYVEEMTHS